MRNKKEVLIKCAPRFNQHFPNSLESRESSPQELFEKVYSEAEMMNEMNPKLKALIAAGLIGTAGLGMQSCSMPVDSGVEVVVNTFKQHGLKVTDEEARMLYNSKGWAIDTIGKFLGLEDADSWQFYKYDNGFRLVNSEDSEDSMGYYSYLFEDEKICFLISKADIGKFKAAGLK